VLYQLSYCPLWAALGRLRHSTIMTWGAVPG